MLFKSINPEGGDNAMFSMERIGTNIMRCRKSIGMTQMELANKMGISFQAVSNWERGLSCPDIAKLVELSELFEVSVDDLLGNKRAAKIVENIENEDIPELEVNEIKEVAPFLKQKQIDDVVEKSGNIDVKEIVGVAPFLSQEFVDNVAKKAYEEEGVEAIVSLLPFISQTFIDNIASKAYAESGISGIVSLAPFVSDKLLTSITMEVLEKDGISAVKKILPFIDSKILEEYIMRKNR